MSGEVQRLSLLLRLRCCGVRQLQRSIAVYQLQRMGADGSDRLRLA